MDIVKFNYKNHRGVVAERHVRNPRLQFEYKPGFGYQPGWFLHGFDLDKQAPRSFALSHIILPDTYTLKVYQIEESI